MVEGVLRGRDVARDFRDDAGEGVARPVQVEALDAGLARVLLQILDEAVRRECVARLARPVVTRPQRRIRLERVEPIGGREVVYKRLLHLRLTHFPAPVVTALVPILQHQRLADVNVLPPQPDGLLPP